MYNWSYEYYKNKLTPKEQIAYVIIFHSWYARKQKVIVPRNQLNVDSFEHIIEAIMKDHPELFWVNYYQYNIKIMSSFTEITLNFFFNDSKIQKLYQEAENWKHCICAKIPFNFNAREKVWLLFDYLARQVTYGEQGKAHSHTIIGALGKNNHMSVCEGIAKSFKFLCDGDNIPCIVVFGNANFGVGHKGKHAWNLVECRNNLWHIDVTKELEIAHLVGKATRNNFLHMDNEMIEYEWNREQIPRRI